MINPGDTVYVVSGFNLIQCKVQQTFEHHVTLTDMGRADKAQVFKSRIEGIKGLIHVTERHVRLLKGQLLREDDHA